MDGASIVARGETSEMLEASEASLDAATLFVVDRGPGDGDLSAAIHGETASASISARMARKALLS